MKKAFLYLGCLSFDIIAWAVVLLLCLLIWTKPLISKRSLACVIKPRWYTNWWLERWNGGTLGHAIVYGNAQFRDTPLEYHEGVHVEQYEASMLMGFFIGAIVAAVTGNYILGCIIWTTAGAVSYVVAGLVSLLLNKEFYRGNHLEEAARAKTTQWANQ